MATHLNLLTILFTMAGTMHLLVAVNGPLGASSFTVKGPGAAYLPQTANGLHTLFGLSFIDIAIYLLCLALVWITWRQTIVAWLKRLLEWCISEVKNQFELKK